MKFLRSLLKRSATIIAEDRLARLRLQDVSDQERLDLLNAAWRRAVELSPFWRRSAAGSRQFGSIADFRQLPPVSRADIQAAGADAHAIDCQVVSTGRTGGSTGEPLTVPLLKSEYDLVRSGPILVRLIWGVEPSDKIALIWGHRQSMSRGIRGVLTRAKRRIADRLLGYTRLDAYRLDDATARAYADVLANSRCRGVYGYASALATVAAAARGRNDRARRPRLKAVISTSEFMPPDTRCEVATAFSCPLGLEYGAVECGVIGSTTSWTDGYVFFNGEYLVESASAVEHPGYRELLVTKLYPSGLPLFRYRTGDLVADGADPGEGCLELDGCRDMLGRANDAIILSDGRRIHPEVITHAVVGNPRIAAFQVHQDRDKKIEIRYITTDAPLALAEEDGIRASLGRVDPSLARVSLVHVRSLAKTPAGKVRFVVSNAT